MKHIPQTIIAIPNTETIDTPYLGTLDPQGYFMYSLYTAQGPFNLVRILYHPPIIPIQFPYKEF